jgi:SAM-dependent methyltransferase
MTTSADAREFYNRIDPARWGRELTPESWAVTRLWLDNAVPDREGPVLELGCGRGAMPGIAPRYIGLDLSFPALAAVDEPFPRIAADMEQLPVGTSSIELVVSFAAIEHVPHPERVLEEITRILRPGGVALLAPAWHCRPWAAEGLEFRGYDELTFTQRLRKRLIPFRNAVVWRALFEAPRRLMRELGALRRRPMTFGYQRLTPNLNAYVGTDCDAFTSMDPHAAILFFASRGWEVLSHPGVWQRLASRAEPVVVRKPK